VKLHRQVQRTRGQLEQALVELVSERDYDAITIQDILDRANVGRTTFYQHYDGKDDLFLNSHQAILSRVQAEQLYPLSREELLSPEAPPRMIAAYQHLEAARGRLLRIFQGKDGLLTLRRVLREWNAQQIEDSLHAAFVGCESEIPLEILANYLAGSHLALVQWWLEGRRTTPADEIAHTYHRLQRAAICDAFGLSDNR
jgi:AcrR family transcriptional regulator